jgi:hypothetical protein
MINSKPTIELDVNSIYNFRSKIDTQNLNRSNSTEVKQDPRSEDDE